ncbi:uncharacterized protein PRCAT00006224001 [Priceomyces carsonii]|uniref:uncharacterized protein n=1 Tax=Priceomyces carsonii TaxID=28549 RepID=UPI002EDBB09C|nr:unnamed protein product [Priceomyces carsonii]
MKQELHNPYDSATFGNSLLLRVDGAIGAMSLSPNGRDAVLAGRRGLFIIDLDDPFTTPRWLHHITSWEVADVQWSPHHAVKPSWCISTSNQKALLWDLARPSNNAIVNVLHQHTRAITDINFHPSDPEILSTCSIDTFVLGWDMRTPRKPVMKWAEWRAGATQVKWNHENPFEIASSHDNNFYIWDTRKGALPVLKINAAHNGKINGIDFSNGLSNIITCSNDKKVKFWNLKSDIVDKISKRVSFFENMDTNEGAVQPSVVVNTDFPVARARSLPFGKDKSCGIMPLRGGDNAIHIVNYDAAYKAALTSREGQEIECDSIYTFKGHKGAIKDFLWRTRHETYEGISDKQKWKEFQLVTWSSQDFDLKLWPHDDDLYKSVNYNPSYQRILDVFSNGDLGNDDNSDVQSFETEELKNDKNTLYNYQTYCVEPPVTIDDLKKKCNGDILSSLVLYRIYERQKQSGNTASQLNHLDWISGVRIGHSGNTSRKDGIDEQDGPSNLGEEVSIVGHKFPKIRFEKISVSTGELVISLRGPVSEQNILEKVATSTTDNDETEANTTIERENSKDQGPPKTENSLSQSVTLVSQDGKSHDGDNSLSLSSNNLSAANEESTAEQKLVFIRMEIKFPRNYPFGEDELHARLRRLLKLKKQTAVRFHIEETHELTASIKNEMLKNLNEIASFFTAKHHTYCLEPCLRYLMGEKIEMSDLILLDTSQDVTRNGEEVVENIEKVGWADDLVGEHDPIRMKDDSSGEEDVDVFADLIPAANDPEIINSSESLNYTKNESQETSGLLQPSEFADLENEYTQQRPYFDSTPLPKGCGACWSATGKLVCFFFPKIANEESKELQELSNLNFTDGGFSLKQHGSRSHHKRPQRLNSGQSGSIISSTDKSDSEISEEVNDSDTENESDDARSDTSSDDSFVDDLDEMFQEDLTIRPRVPGLFKASLGLGNRYASYNRLNKFTSQGETGSNAISSGRAESSHGLKKKKSRGTSKNKNIVGIFDYRYLIPVKYELAREYRVLGDAPEALARYNSEVASRYGYREISEVWKLLEMVLTKDIDVYSLNESAYRGNNHQNIAENNDVEALNQLVRSSNIVQQALQNNTYRIYWGTHPFGHTWLIKEIFRYFELNGNIQMLAMLSCILYENSQNVKKNPSDLFKIPIHTPYQVPPPPPSAVAMHQFNENNQHNVISNQHERYGLSHRDSITTDRKSSTYINNPPLSITKRDPLNSTPPYANSITSSVEVSSLKDLSPEPNSMISKSSQSFVLLPMNEYLANNELFKDNNGLSAKLRYSIRRSSKKQQQDSKRTKSNQLSTNLFSKSKGKVGQPPIITLDMMNTEDLDLFDDVYSSSLLDSQDDEKVRRYREAYSQILFLWGFPINRIKILKFNYPDSDGCKERSLFDEHKSLFGFRNRGKALSNQQMVTTCTSVITAKFNVWNTSKQKSFKYCNLCNLMVTKNFTVCTNCEHILHSHCAFEWWPNANEDETSQYCPSGCGCRCLDHMI